MLNFDFSDDILTPFELATIDSYTKANEIIEHLEEGIKRGINPNDVEIDYTGVEPTDLIRIKSEVENFAKRWGY